MRKRLVRLLSRAAVATLISAALATAGVARTPVANAATSPVAGSWGPQDLQSVYGMSQDTGAGETVALVTAYDDPNAESDLNVYRSQYSLAACTTGNGCFARYDQNGGTTYPTGGQNTWDDYDSMSLDAISAVCPGCHIIMVEANTSAITDLGQAVNEAVQLGAKFVDYDAAMPELEIGSAATEQSYDTSYFNHPNVAITAPAGDSGYSSGVSYPAASQGVTAVGGTVLTHNSGTYTETAWSSTGSGCSEWEAKPSWQTDTLCSGRTLNDVAAVATNVAYYDSATNDWSTSSGTVTSAAIVAAYYALLAAHGTTLGTTPVQYLYNHASTLTDITSGSNGTCTPTALCNAGTGYDGPTGLGSVASSSHTVSTSPNPVVYDKNFTSLEVYAITSTGTLEEDAYTTSSGWSGWTSRGAPSGVTLTGTPSAAYNTASGNLEVYATGNNGHLEETWYVPGSGWHAWSDITGSSGPTLASSPAAFYDTVTGHMDVFATGTNNHLEEAYYTTAWTLKDLAGSITGTPSPMHDAIFNFTEVYATATNGTLEEYSSNSSGTWTLSNHGGAISGSPSAMDDTVTGNLEIYATGSGASGTNIEQVSYAAGTGWNAWRNLGGSVTGSPSALVDTATGNPEVYATGTNGYLTSTAWTSSAGWKAWGTIGSGTTVTGTPDAFYDQVTSALDIYALTSGSVSEISWKSSWSSWKNLGSTLTFLAP